MKKHYLLFCISALLLCSCGDKDLTEYGGSSLMAMSNRHPSNVEMVSRTVPIPHTYDQLETVVALPEPQPEYAPHILTDDEKQAISTELYNALQEYYGTVHYKNNYDVDAYFNAFDNDTVRQKEYEIANDTANRHGITVEDLLSFYPYQFKSNEVASLDKEQIRNEKEQEGYRFLEESYQEVVDEFSKREDFYDVSFYRKDNQFFISLLFDGMLFISESVDFFKEKDARQLEEEIFNYIRELSNTLKTKLDNDYGLNKGIVTVSLYDKSDPNKVLFVFTNGNMVYNYLDNIKEDNPSWLLEEWEYLGD